MHLNPLQEWEEGDGDYVAPELLAAGSDATPAADLFSLGATLYEVSKSRSPPAADSDALAMIFCVVSCV